MITINLKDAKIQLGGAFENALCWIKMRDGSRYDPGRKEWTIPERIEEFARFCSFPIDILSSSSSLSRYQAGNHITKYGNAYSEKDWDFAQRSRRLESRIAASTAGEWEALDRWLGQECLKISSNEEIASKLARWIRDAQLEERIELGYLRFSSPEQEARVEALANQYYRKIEQVASRERDEIELAQENLAKELGIED